MCHWIYWTVILKMASMILQHLDATDQLLNGMSGAARDVTTRRQARIIINLLESATLYVSEASPLVSRMQSVNWPTEIKPSSSLQSMQRVIPASYKTIRYSRTI